MGTAHVQLDISASPRFFLSWYCNILIFQFKIFRIFFFLKKIFSRPFLSPRSTPHIQLGCSTWPRFRRREEIIGSGRQEDKLNTFGMLCWYIKGESARKQKVEREDSTTFLFGNLWHLFVRNRHDGSENSFADCRTRSQHIMKVVVPDNQPLCPFPLTYWTQV